MRILTLTALISFATLSFADDPPPINPPVLPAKEVKRLPIAVFVGVKHRSIEGIDVRRDDAWYEAPAVVVYPLGYGKGVFLSPFASTNDIRRAAGLEVSPAAVPFSKTAPRDGLPFDAGSLPERFRWIAKEMEPYEPANLVQQSFNRSGLASMGMVSRNVLDRKWRVPGGCENVGDFQSRLFRGKGNTVRNWTDHATEEELSEIIHQRSYGDGAKFVEVLSHGGKVFSIRLAEKESGKWDRRTIYRNSDADPPGFVAIKNSECASCHALAGSGEYGGPRIPGGDTVLSEPIVEGVYQGPIRPFGNSRVIRRR